MQKPRIDFRNPHPLSGGRALWRMLQNYINWMYTYVTTTKSFVLEIR